MLVVDLDTVLVSPPPRFVAAAMTPVRCGSVCELQDLDPQETYMYTCCSFTVVSSSINSMV